MIFNFDGWGACKIVRWSFLAAFISINALSVNAQSVSSSPRLEGSVYISPKFSLTETWTNNLSLDNNVSKSGWITEISPGISARSGSGKIKGYLNYSLNVFNHNKNNANNSFQNSLDSSTNIELVDGHGFLNLTGVIAQKTVSAFSIQNSNFNNLNANKTEVSTYSLTPYYRGKVSRFLGYEAKYSLTTTRAKNEDNFSSNTNIASIAINGDDFFGKLSWILSANHQIVSRDNSEDTKVDSLKISINYPIINNLIFSVSGGREIQNYTSVAQKSSWTSGMGINWAISETTKLSLGIENNPLGKMHSLNFEHRTPRTSWRFSDTKSTSFSTAVNSSSLNGNFDLLFNQFSSIESDPIKRAQLVNNYLQAYGIDRNSTAVNGYLTSGTSLQRAQSLSFALLGIRDSITLTAVRSNGKSVFNSSTLVDDFSNSDLIKQDGVTASYTHRLTSDTVVSNQISVQKTYGQLNSQYSKTKSANVSLSTRVGSQAYLILSARQSVSSSASFPYKETAVTGSLTVQF